jgi:membrane-associated phospholipid phosphatase
MIGARPPRALRATAWAVVAAGVAAPVVRRRVKAPPLVVQSVAFCAPIALCVAVRRSRTRDVATCCLQMWAYMAAYKSPHDDPAGQTQRVHVDYPIAIDRVIGLGEIPTVRLQRRLALAETGMPAAGGRRPASVGPEGPRWRTLDKALVWTHWSWFMVPHGTLVYIMLRYPQRFERAAVLTYAVFDVGAMVYWVLPTAPPWYAAAAPENGLTDGVDWLSGRGEAEGGHRTPHRMVEVRRMMVEYGASFWHDGWGPLYSVFGGNPLAAMPSLHFATSVMAALLLAETGPAAGAVGWAYAATLGFALVYLGEHYAADLVGGAVLTVVVRRLGPRAAPLLRNVRRAVAALEAKAHAAG